MNKQDKFVTKIATWAITPDGYAYLFGVIDESEDVSRDRHEKMMMDPVWNGYKFINVPIPIQIPDEVANKTIME